MRSSTTSVIVVLVILVTIPFWIGLAGGILGILGAILGAVFGVFFGLLGSILSWPFQGSWHCHWPFDGFWPDNAFSIAAIILLVIILVKARR